MADTNKELAARARTIADEASLTRQAALCCNAALATTNTIKAARAVIAEALAPDMRDATLQVLDELTAEPEAYPSLIGVFCDRCGVTVERDYLVSDQDSQKARFEYARAALRAEGWQCTPAGDLCPTCRTPDQGETP